MDLVSDDLKDDLHRYLQRGREAIVWKLDGLSEYDVRRPMVDSGTNLLGLVKHLSYGEAWYFGRCFGRPFEESLDNWADEAEPNHDMYARADESRADIVDRYQRACTHSDETIRSLSLDTTGTVPWWSPPKGKQPTLGWLLVHVATETHRHAGHADIMRELLDGATGIRADSTNMPEVDGAFWSTYRERLEKIARQA
jgi:Protein of unknown function (DUF664)